MASHRVPHSKYFRNRLFGRLRHGRKAKNFLADEVAALAASATGQTVVPVRTTNTKAEALVVFGGNLSNGNTLTIGDVTYTFKSALTEAKAVGTLTNDGSNITAADTVTIGGQVYTFKAALTEAKAVGTLTNDGTDFANADTVTIGGKTYTFQSSLTNVDGNVKIGASVTATLLNLKNAINLGAGTPGTDYALATTAHTTVDATASDATTVSLRAKTVGVAGNAIATTETSLHNAFGAVTLTGGVAAIANEVFRGASNTASMTNLFEAINAGANVGVDYSTGTVANASVIATNPTGTTVVATAKTIGLAGNAIATTEASTHLGWGGLVLSGGVEAVANEILVDDTAAHTRDNVVVAVTAGAGGGTKYSSTTVVHPKVTAVAATADLLLTMLLAANVAPGKGVKLAKVATNLTLPTLTQLDGPGWTATGHAYVDGEGPCVLTNSGGGLPAGAPTTPVWVHVINTNRIAIATSLEALRKGNFVPTTTLGTGTHTLKRQVTTAGLFGTLKRNKPRTVDAATDIDSLR